MQGSTENAIFISYSWTSEPHKQWVLELAERLTADGLHVALDVWDLKAGQDKYAFMEQMVTDADIKKVLVICDEGYQKKADLRKGGVGTESQLISQEVYEKVDQEKFIPIIVEKDQDGQPCMPKYLATRVYFDMSATARFEEEYQKLIRNLYDKPDRKRPPIGTPPAYITEEARTLPKSASVLKSSLEYSAPPFSSNSFIYNFFNEFLSDLEGFRFKSVPEEPHDDETIIRLIEQMRPLRDSFNSFTNTLLQHDISDEDIDLVHDNLERVGQFQFRPPDVREYREYDWDNYRFLCYELMLHLGASLIRRGKFSFASNLMGSTYFYRNNLARASFGTIAIFNQSIRSLNVQRNSRLALKRVSVTADIIKTRAEGSGTSFEELVQIDLLLHYRTILEITDSAGGSRHASQAGIWFPHLSTYASFQNNLPILQKLVSAQYFNRFKVLFDVASPDDLKEKVERGAAVAASYYQGVDTFQYSIPDLSSAMQIDKLASLA